MGGQWRIAERGSPGGVEKRGEGAGDGDVAAAAAAVGHEQCRGTVGGCGDGRGDGGGGVVVEVGVGWSPGPWWGVWCSDVVVTHCVVVVGCEQGGEVEEGVGHGGEEPERDCCPQPGIAVGEISLRSVLSGIEIVKSAARQRIMSLSEVRYERMGEGQELSVTPPTFLLCQLTESGPVGLPLRLLVC